MDKLQYPLDNIWFSRGFTSSHRGVDIGWFTKYGQNMPVFAPGAGKVVAAVDGCGNTYSTGVPTWGNYVKIYHGLDEHNKPIYTLQGHMLKGSICVKVGQTVTRGQQIGRMNNSGYSNGSHDHSEVYVGGSGTAYRVNPVDYLYAYPHQYVEPASEKTYGIKHYTPVETVGVPVARDAEKRQLNVTAGTLNWREGPTTNSTSKGHATPGVYDITGATTEADGYKWYPVADTAGLTGYFAAIDGALEVYPYTEYVGTPDGQDTTVDQLYVYHDKLRARCAANGSVCGYINRGYYDIRLADKQTAGNYDWYPLNNTYWVAVIAGASEIVKAEVPATYTAIVGPMTAGDRDTIVKLASDLKISCEVKET